METLDMVDIRRWARENGHTVGVRGPINAKVISAYLQAQAMMHADIGGTYDMTHGEPERDGDE